MKKAKPKTVNDAPRTKKVLGMPFKLVRRTPTGYETWVNTKPQMLDPSIYLDMQPWDNGPVACSWSASSANIETETEYHSPQEALKGLYSALQKALNQQQRAMTYIRKRTSVLLGPPHTY